MSHKVANIIRVFLDHDRDVTLCHVNVLASLHGVKEDQRTVRAMAALTGYSKPTISRAIDYWEGWDMVGRRDDLLDGRSMFVDLTASGMALLAAAKAA